jgi:ADP-heptose:LPS heptosyltransferase
MQGRKFVDKNKKISLVIKAQAYFIGFCYDTINFLFKVFSLILWPRKIQNSSKKICIYRVGNIGDIICAIPAIIAIRRAYPDACITLLTSPGKKGSPGAKELLEGVWFIDKLWVYYSDEIGNSRKTVEFIKKIRVEKFDLLIYFPQELITLKTLFRNLIFIKLCRIKKAVGFEYSTIKKWTKAQSAVYQFDNEVDRLINLLKRWNIPISGKIEYDLPIPKNIQEAALKIIDENKINSKLIFGIMPSASYEDNQWSLDNFSEVSKFILQKYKDCQIVIFGGSGDKDKGEYIKNQIGSDAVINLCGETSLLETAFVVNKLTLLVSNNTGLMHMAALAGIKVVAIFSPAELNGKWRPYGENSKELINRSASECDGYYYKKTQNCHERINDVSVEEVKNEIVNFI